MIKTPLKQHYPLIQINERKTTISQIDEAEEEEEKINNKTLNVEVTTTSNTFFKAISTQLQFLKARKKVTEN